MLMAEDMQLAHVNNCQLPTYVIVFKMALNVFLFGLCWVQIENFQVDCG